MEDPMLLARLQHRLSRIGRPREEEEIMQITVPYIIHQFLKTKLDLFTVIFLVNHQI